MDGGVRQAVVHGVAKSRTRLSNFTFIFTFMHWRRKWQPTPVLLPGESQELRSLVGCCLWGHTESDTTEVTQQQQLVAIDNSIQKQYRMQKERVPWNQRLGFTSSIITCQMCDFSEIKLDKAQFSVLQNKVHKVFPTFYKDLCAHLLNHVQLFAAPQTVTSQTLLRMEFSRQEYWSGVPFPTPGNLPDPGIEPASLALVGRFFTSGTTWETIRTYREKQIRL